MCVWSHLDAQKAKTKQCPGARLFIQTVFIHTHVCVCRYDTIHFRAVFNRTAPLRLTQRDHLSANQQRYWFSSANHFNGHCIRIYRIFLVRLPLWSCSYINSVELTLYVFVCVFATVFRFLPNSLSRIKKQSVSTCFLCVCVSARKIHKKN